jgi:predicted DNA-binding transcriptional regulator AlpA
MHHLPETGYVRLWQIIGAPGDPGAKPPKPPIPAVIPVSKSTWWEGVRTGRYPQPVRTLGRRITCWKVEEIRALIQQASA